MRPNLTNSQVKLVFHRMVKEKETIDEALAHFNNFVEYDEAAIVEIVKKVLQDNPEAVKKIKENNENFINLLSENEIKLAPGATVWDAWDFVNEETK